MSSGYDGDFDRAPKEKANKNDVKNTDSIETNRDKQKTNDLKLNEEIKLNPITRIDKSRLDNTIDFNETRQNESQELPINQPKGNDLIGRPRFHDDIGPGIPLGYIGQKEFPDLLDGGNQVGPAQIQNAFNVEQDNRGIY